ncbi:MAG TPA: cupin domain-containing protein [Thermoleophilaceae bacterium]
MRKFNVFSPAPEYDSSDPEGYRAGRDSFGAKIGAEQIGASVYELPPGQSVCPYHYEYPNEEWLMVLEGRPTLRHPEGEDELEPGDTVAFPPGPDGAHKVTNNTDERARIIMFSTEVPPFVAVYPDSDKLLVKPHRYDSHDRLMVRRESSVDYYDGETP